jgi:O-antigen biosynthesis protein
MARDGEIDNRREDAPHEMDHDRLREALEAEIARLRRDAQQDRAALRHLERAYAAKIGEVAAIYASRSWRAAMLLRAATNLRRHLVRPRRPPAAVVVATPTHAIAHPVAADAPARAELTATAPAVSLVVLGATAASVAGLLGTLTHTPAGATFEVLVALPADAPLPAMAADAPLPAMAGVRAVAATDGDTLAAVCNRAAALAHGDHLAIWHASATPQPGWLGALADCLARHASVGMVGGVLLGADGLLQAAGASIEVDGRLTPLGRGEPPAHPAYAGVEAVDANPLGCAMLPRGVWQRFGGLDPDIAAIDHAVAELGVRLRGEGLRVLRQPFARLTGQPTPPRDDWADAYGRWRLRGLRFAHGHGLASLGLPPPPAPRALFFDHYVPTPDRDSGSADIAWHLRIFAELGWQVTLLPVNDLARDDRYVDDLRRAGIRVVANGWAAAFTEFLARTPEPFDLLVVHRGSLVAEPMLDALQRHSPQARLVFNTVDLHFLRMEREALLHRSPGMLEEAFRMQRTELAAITRADCTILLSLAERRMIADMLPRARTCVIPIMRDIPGRRAPFAPRRGAMFVGSFQHRPNVDAIVTFARDVWPLVRQRLDTTLTVVGADAPAEVLALASPGSGIAVAGYVADLEAALAACRLTVAPLRYGAGIKGKIVTSLVNGVPCVASPVAVEGMGMTEQAHVRVATTPQEFADAVVDVHERPELWEALSEGGLRFARETFSVAEARRRICAMLTDLGLPAQPLNAGDTMAGDAGAAL